MKDFREVLEQTDDKPMLEQRDELTSAEFERELLTNRVLKVVAPVALSLLTSPMTVASAYLQMAVKQPVNPIDEKLAMQRERNLAINTRFISNGMYGDNKPYLPAAVKGYNQAFQQLAQQGLFGFYKGNLTYLVLTFVNSSVRAAAIGVLAKQPFDQLTSNAITILLCSATDILTTPLMTVQSRLILQNRTPNFRSKPQ